MFCFIKLENNKTKKNHVMVYKTFNAYERKGDQNYLTLCKGEICQSFGGSGRNVSELWPSVICLGGKYKDSFWRVVAQCTAALPEDKPRYFMLRVKYVKLNSMLFSCVSLSDWLVFQRVS